MNRGRLYFVVAHGKDAGAKVLVEDAPRIVGRALDADLVLVNARVSRHHLIVRAEGDGARVTTREKAAPFMVDGAPQTDVLVRVGGTIVVGQTTLVLMLVASPEAAAGGEHSTEVSVLMTGLAADVRGLAAAMELVEALDAADEDEDIRPVLTAWGSKYLGAIDASLVVGEAAAKELGLVEEAAPRVLERPGTAPDTLFVAAPARGAEPAWIAFTCTRPTKAGGAGGGLTDTSRRLVAVAAQLCASTLARVRSLRDSRKEREILRRATVGSAHSFLGDSAAAHEVSKLAKRLAGSDAVALLEGETGVGKTFLARLIHEAGPRAKAPLRVLNCAAIPETLLESEVFGHERGAFTGATTSKPGALEAAGHGTVLLDEIGELPLASQAKLLRVIEEKRFERLGSNRSIPLAARILTATNRDLGAMAEAGTFRSDLFYRIAVVRVRIPPLRERGADLTLLAERILADLAPSAGRRVSGFSPATLDVMRRYPWPGNVRELRNAIERALVVGDGAMIEPEDFPETVRSATPPQPTDEALVRLPAKLDWLESRAIAAALKATGGNQKRAALLLGINRVTLHRKLRAEGKSGENDDGDEG